MSLADLRRRIVTATLQSGAGHIPSAFSILEIVAALYNGGMRDGDRFVLSKGHGCLALYAVLAEKGLIGFDELESFAMPGSRLGGHPDALKVPGVEFSTGSLGHGLALGAGLALAKKIKGDPGKVFVLVGDGECQEGSTWEAAGIISEMRLNVVCIVDANGTHMDSETLVKRFFTFGLKALRPDGHNIKELVALFQHWDGPLALVARTVKGKGCATFEKDPEAWHHRAPKPDELETILAEIA